MNNFDIERKGYNKKEVDKYLFELSSKYEQQIEKLNQDKMEIQAELMQSRLELDSYKSKDDQISNALVVAVETAKEIESSAKTVYELEIKRVKVLYKKWSNILNEIRALYPNINKMSGISTLFNEFQEALNKILQKENEISQMPSNVSSTAEKVYAKTLLSRMWGKNANTDVKKKKNVIEPTTTVKRADTAEKTREEYKQMDFSSQQKANESEGEFEKFLKSEFEDFDNFQYKSSHKDSNISPEKKSKYLDALEQSLNKSQSTDDNQFDMLEALKPKEDLKDIMKSFNLDD